MFATQLNGSDQSKYQRTSSTKTKEVIHLNGGIELVPGKNGLSTRRPSALRLAPIDTHVLCDSSEIDGHGSFTVSKLPKSIDIGFSDLSYAVKTNFFKKGMYNYIIITFFLLIFNV